MTSGIFDSSILIDCLRGRVDAIAFLATQSTATRPHTHLFVAAELLTGARDKHEQTLIDSFLETFERWRVSSALCRAVGLRTPLAF